MAERQLSLDEMAADMAGQLLKGGGAAGDLPVGRGGSSGAEGGFTPQAGGKPMGSDAAKAQAEEDELGKAGKTGAQMTSEPGHQGPGGQTGTAITSEPKGQDGGGCGDGGNLAQSGDEAARARKAGKVGGQSGSAGGGLPEDEDEKARARKGGKVGMAKAVDDEEDDEDEEEMGKGGIDADDLMKSLQTLEAIAQGSTVAAPAERRAELGTKLAEGTLSKSEMTELSDLMKSSEATATDDSTGAIDDLPEEDDDFEKSYQEQFAEDTALGEGYEVSSFLERHSQMTAAALDQVQTTLAKSLETHRDHTSSFNAQLAKSLMGMAQLGKSQNEMVKSLAERLDHIEQQPQPRRGVTSASQVLNKSMGGAEVGQPQGITRTQIADSLEQMAMRGVEVTASGHRVDLSMALVEQPNPQIAKSLIGDIEAWTQKNTGSVNVR